MFGTSYIGQKTNDVVLSACFDTKDKVQELLQGYLAGGPLLEEHVEWFFYQPIFNSDDLGAIVVYESRKFEDLIRDPRIIEVRQIKNGSWCICLRNYIDSEERFDLFRKWYVSDQNILYTDWLFEETGQY